MSLLKSIPSYQDEDLITGCCPKFYPEKWDRKNFDFSDLCFVKAESNAFMHIPLNLGSVMTRVQMKIDEEEAQPDHKYLILSKDVSAFKTVHYFYVQSHMTKMNLEKVKGVFEARVFEGGYNELPNWMQEIEEDWQSKGKQLSEQYTFYTTCPKCAKTYGHNYIVLLTR